jgi:hypothetical protein
MKTKILFIITLIGLFSCHEPDADTKKEELKNILAAYYDGMAKKDLQKLNDLTTANFVMYEEGVIYNNASAIKSIEGLPPFTVTYKFDSMNATIDKINASAYYVREANLTMKDSTMKDVIYPPFHFLESATFYKEGKKWKLRFIHSTMRK